MARKRTAYMQAPQPYIPDREDITSLDGLRYNGVDYGAERRARVRQQNTERQQREAARREEEPPVHTQAWLAAALRNSLRSPMRQTNQAYVDECKARKREREGL